MYDEALRPSGLRSTQFTLLQALNIAPSISQKQLGELLGLDSTTLTRTLARLRRKGWVRSQPGADRRELQIQLSAAGRREFRRVLPFWASAQKRLRRCTLEPRHRCRRAHRRSWKATVTSTGLSAHRP
jgi:DNA-binding MarR family transcriptional regulator